MEETGTGTGTTNQEKELDNMEMEMELLDEKYAVCTGEFTEGEKQYLLKKGHIRINENGDISQASTLVESDFEDDISLNCSVESEAVIDEGEDVLEIGKLQVADDNIENAYGCLSATTDRKEQSRSISTPASSKKILRISTRVSQLTNDKSTPKKMDVSSKSDSGVRRSEIEHLVKQSMDPSENEKSYVSETPLVQKIESSGVSDNRLVHEIDSSVLPVAVGLNDSKFVDEEPAAQDLDCTTESGCKMVLEVEDADSMETVSILGQNLSANGSEVMKAPAVEDVQTVETETAETSKEEKSVVPEKPLIENVQPEEGIPTSVFDAECLEAEVNSDECAVSKSPIIIKECSSMISSRSEEIEEQHPIDTVSSEDEAKDGLTVSVLQHMSNVKELRGCIEDICEPSADVSLDMFEVSNSQRVEKRPSHVGLEGLFQATPVPVSPKVQHSAKNVRMSRKDEKGLPKFTSTPTVTPASSNKVLRRSTRVAQLANKSLKATMNTSSMSKSEFGLTVSDDLGTPLAEEIKSPSVLDTPLVQEIVSSEVVDLETPLVQETESSDEFKTLLVQDVESSDFIKTPFVQQDIESSGVLDASNVGLEGLFQATPIPLTPKVRQSGRIAQKSLLVQLNESTKDGKGLPKFTSTPTVTPASSTKVLRRSTRVAHLANKSITTTMNTSLISEGGVRLREIESDIVEGSFTEESESPNILRTRLVQEIESSVVSESTFLHETESSGVEQVSSVGLEGLFQATPVPVTPEVRQSGRIVQKSFLVQLNQPTKDLKGLPRLDSALKVTPATACSPKVLRRSTRVAPSANKSITTTRNTSLISDSEVTMREIELSNVGKTPFVQEIEVSNVVDTPFGQQEVQLSNGVDTPFEQQEFESSGISDSRLVHEIDSSVLPVTVGLNDSKFVDEEPAAQDFDCTTESGCKMVLEVEDADSMETVSILGQNLSANGSEVMKAPAVEDVQTVETETAETSKEEKSVVPEKRLIENVQPEEGIPTSVFDAESLEAEVNSDECAVSKSPIIIKECSSMISSRSEEIEEQHPIDTVSSEDEATDGLTVSVLYRMSNGDERGIEDISEPLVNDSLSILKASNCRKVDIRASSVGLEGLFQATPVPITPKVRQSTRIARKSLLVQLNQTTKEMNDLPRLASTPIVTPTSSTKVLRRSTRVASSVNKSITTTRDTSLISESGVKVKETESSDYVVTPLVQEVESKDDLKTSLGPEILPTEILKTPFEEQKVESDNLETPLKQINESTDDLKTYLGRENKSLGVVGIPVVQEVESTDELETSLGQETVPTEVLKTASGEQEVELDDLETPLVQEVESTDDSETSLKKLDSSDEMGTRLEQQEIKSTGILDGRLLQETDSSVSSVTVGLKNPEVVDGATTAQDFDCTTEIDCTMFLEIDDPDVVGQPLNISGVMKTPAVEDIQAKTCKDEKSSVSENSSIDNLKPGETVRTSFANAEFRETELTNDEYTKTESSGLIKQLLSMSISSDSQEIEQHPIDTVSAEDETREDLTVSVLNRMSDGDERGIEDISEPSVNDSLSMLEVSNCKKVDVRASSVGLEGLFQATPVPITPKLRQSTRIARKSLLVQLNQTTKARNSSLGYGFASVNTKNQIAVTSSNTSMKNTLTDSPCLINLDSSSHVPYSSPCLINLDTSICPEQDIRSSSSAVTVSAVPKEANPVELAACKLDETADEKNGTTINESEEHNQTNNTNLDFSGSYNAQTIQNDTQSDVFETSQDESICENESKDDLEGTFELVEKLLALNEEAEAREALEQNQEKTSKFNSSTRVIGETMQKSPVRNLIKTPGKQPVSSNSTSGRRAQWSPSPQLLLPNRVAELKKKGGSLFSPSPPRPMTQTNVAKQAQKATKAKNVHTSQAFKAPTPRAKAVKVTGSNILSSPNPKILTPSRRSLAGVQAKVDSGLRGASPGASLGLASPVANYIHSKAAPSPFRRNPCFPSLTESKCMSTGKVWPTQTKPTANTTHGSCIPRPSLPHLGSGASAKSVDKRLSSSLLNSSRFNSKQGAPSSQGDKFQSKAYTAPANVQPLNNSSYAEKHRKEDYLCLRHTGDRDENCDASIVHNASIHKKFIPSRLTTPKSYVKSVK